MKKNKQTTFGIIIGTREFFNSERSSEKLLQASGITVVPVDLSEILNAAVKMDDASPEVKAKIEEMHAYGKIPGHIPKENTIKQAKFSISAENWICENNIDAAAFQCWESLQQNYGCAAGPFTFFRISTDDTSGLIKSYVGEGEFADDPYGMDGGIAVCKVKYLQTLMKVLCRNGFEHHVAMTRSHVADILLEAVEIYLGWDLYYHS